MNELDRILLAVEAPESSSDFAAKVMLAVRQETQARTLSVPWLVLLVGVFVVFVGVPLVILTVEGSHSLSGGNALSAKMLWFVGLLVLTAVAAVLPQQLLES